MEKYVYVCPDAGPILCDYEEPDTSGGNWQEDEQSHIIANAFEHLAKRIPLVWYAVQFVAYADCVSDSDKKASDYRSIAIDLMYVYDSESGAYEDPSYDPEYEFEALEFVQQNWYDTAFANASAKTKEQFLSLLEHELATDVS